MQSIQLFLRVGVLGQNGLDGVLRSVELREVYSAGGTAFGVFEPCIDIRDVLVDNALIQTRIVRVGLANGFKLLSVLLERLSPLLLVDPGRLGERIDLDHCTQGVILNFSLLAQIGGFGFLGVDLQFKVSQISFVLCGVSGFKSKRCCSPASTMVGCKAIPDDLRLLLHGQRTTDI